MKKFVEILTESVVTSAITTLKQDLADARDEGFSKELLQKGNDILKKIQDSRSVKLTPDQRKKLDKVIEALSDEMWENESSFKVYLQHWSRFAQIVGGSNA